MAGWSEPTGVTATDDVDALLALGAARPGIVTLADLPPVTGRFQG